MQVEVFNETSYKNVTKETTNLSVELVHITPEIARNYLNFNKKKPKGICKEFNFLS